MKWTDANKKGVPKLAGNEVMAEVTLEGLPKQNDSFGEKIVQLLYHGRSIASQTFEIYYPATAQHGKLVNETGEHIPNWFFYYKQNAGSGKYQYGCTGKKGEVLKPGQDDKKRRSSTVGPRESLISICDEAYNGDSHYLTQITDGQLRVTGRSELVRYYAAFTGVLRHEQYHASHFSGHVSSGDSDGDGIPNEEEINVTHTDPKVACSVVERAPDPHEFWPDTTCSRDTNDSEIFANGPIEAAAVAGAVTANDWASPGTNYDR